MKIAEMKFNLDKSVSGAILKHILGISKKKIFESDI